MSQTSSNVGLHYWPKHMCIGLQYMYRYACCQLINHVVTSRRLPLKRSTYRANVEKNPESIEVNAA